MGGRRRRYGQLGQSLTERERERERACASIYQREKKKKKKKKKRQNTDGKAHTPRHTAATHTWFEP